MRLYQISELEQLTGIKAHTIRIWEKRYKLIEPDRTSTNYRRYNDEQVKKLLNVSTLLSSGYKISKIAALTAEDLHLKILELQSSKEDDVICTTFINDLLSAIIDFDEQEFEKTYSAVINRFGLFESMLNVFYPLLNKIGLMWSINDVSPAQEHFASCLIKRKIMAATDGLPFAKHKNKKKFLLLLLPGEMHDISLLFANYIIRSGGHETIYLGQDVPNENILLVLKKIKPDIMLTFFTIPQNPKDVYHELKKNLKLGKIKILISGQSAVTSYLQNKINAEVIRHPQDLLTYL